MPNVDEPGAIPMFVDESRVFIDNNNATWVCLHKTAGGSSAQNIASYFATTPEMTSVHYIVGQDGAIVQCVLEKDGAAGNCCLMPGHASYLPNGNLNWWTVSIEHVDPATDNSTPLTDAQKQASFQLVQHICQRHNIPMRAGDASGGIIGHNDIDPVNRSRCPGEYPLDELFAFLATGGGPMVPTGWTDNGATLTAPNKITVTLGFRDYVLNNNWDSSNWPLEEAHVQNPLELSNPSLGAGTAQTFRTSVLEWTPTQGVFVAWSGQELLKLRALLAAQNAPTTPVVSINTQQAISTLQTIDVAIKAVLHDLGVS